MAGNNGSSLKVDFLKYQVLQENLDLVGSVRAFLVPFISLIFICLDIIMFLAMWSKPTIRETSRYILFGQMLLSDAIQLMTTPVLYVCSKSSTIMNKFICSVIILVSVTTFRNSPLILAVMCLERFVAICIPLRHADITTPRRTTITIAVVWVLGSVNCLIDICFLAATDAQFLTSHTVCTREIFMIAKWQFDVYETFNAFSFVSVGVIVISTYTGIMLTARSVNAKKASRTVLLHLGQLVLCLSSFLYASIDRALATGSYIHLQYLIFILLVLLPRCLSPLIYGLRDEGVRPLFFYYLRCGHSRVNPTTGHLML